MSKLERYPSWDTERLETLAGKIGYTGDEAEDARAEVLRIIQSLQASASQYATPADADLWSAEAANARTTAAFYDAKAESALVEAKFVDALLRAGSSVEDIRYATGVYRVGIAFADATRAVHALALAQSALGPARAKVEAAELLLADSKARMDDARAASERRKEMNGRTATKRCSLWRRVLRIKHRR